MVGGGALQIVRFRWHSDSKHQQQDSGHARCAEILQGNDAAFGPQQRLLGGSIVFGLCGGITRSLDDGSPRLTAFT